MNIHTRQSSSCAVAARGGFNRLLAFALYHVIYIHISILTHIYT